MICPRRFVDLLLDRDIGLGTGVPCSYLTGLINCVIDHPHFAYVAAANEGDAVAIACGAELGGKAAAVFFQNSGLGNAVSPLTSLTSTFRIPVLLLTTWRGEPNGPADEPQHEVMGQITTALFDTLQIRWQVLPASEERVPAVLDTAVEHMQGSGAPFALILRKGTFSATSCHRPSGPGILASAPSSDSARTSMEFEADDVLRTVQASLQPGDAVLATTGYTGRALYALGDRVNQFYMVGSMGCVSSLGLGLAMAQPNRRVIVLDGDGALLMRMGALAVVGHYRPANLLHILLDNGVHDSTGGQSTVSSSLDAPALAKACGYPEVIAASRLSTIAQAVGEPAGRLTFVHVRTMPRNDPRLPRPHVAPADIGARFRQWLRAT